MQDAITAILMHVGCGYSAFHKQSQDVLYCKTSLPRVLYGTI